MQAPGRGGGDHRPLHQHLFPNPQLETTLGQCFALRGLLPFTLLRRLGLVPYYVGRSLSPGRLRRELLGQNGEIPFL